MKILVINGPNLNFLGIREKAVYGNEDYAYLCGIIQDKAQNDGDEVCLFQSNHEGAIIDRLQEAYSDGTQAIVINPGAYTHYSIAIADAIKSVNTPVVEVHITNVQAREDYRKISVIGESCKGVVAGFGGYSYILGIMALMNECK